ncbi:hypothetical protein VNO77_41849 [Canavalia gladiata]|uniref:Uncharacterized protein n=1 Tax=Canavalia gladiata TaxID=3824 RepID=A0AAN9JZZ1_CANGL
MLEILVPTLNPWGEGIGLVLDIPCWSWCRLGHDLTNCKQTYTQTLAHSSHGHKATIRTRNRLLFGRFFDAQSLYVIGNSLHTNRIPQDEWLVYHMHFGGLHVPMANTRFSGNGDDRVKQLISVKHRNSLGIEVRL